jgi:copper resistance protein K
MRKHIIAVAVLSALSLPAFAENWPVPPEWQVTQSIELKDGNFVNVYQDGKMAMVCKFGHSLSMTPGQTMQTKDGRTITMNGNETIRVELQNPLLSPKVS